jgi:hypothetical protein
MSTHVLPQLQTIEAELVAQESQLNAQLAALREKLSGIRTVMPMFTGTANAVTSESQPPAPAVAAPVASKAPAPAETKETKPKKTAQKKATVQKKTSAKTAPAKKLDGRTATWQKYTRPGVKNESIPDAVKLILSTQPKKNFKIVDVMTALFQENMPKAQNLKARNRISNVLSGGVRAGDWYKGEWGTYRMTAV